jgi:hypothetical protein
VYLGVRVRLEFVVQRGELRAQRARVGDLAAVHDGDAVAAVGDRVRVLEQLVLLQHRGVPNVGDADGVARVRVGGVAVVAQHLHAVVHLREGGAAGRGKAKVEQSRVSGNGNGGGSGGGSRARRRSWYGFWSRTC